MRACSNYKKLSFFLEAQIRFLVDHANKAVFGSRINLFHNVTLCFKSCTYLVQLGIEVQSCFFHLAASAFWCLSTESEECLSASIGLC